MKYIETNSLSEHLIAFLLSARSTRTYYRILREQRIARYKKQQVQIALSRLQKSGILEKNNDNWNITDQGRILWARTQQFTLIPSPFKKGALAQTIIAFDIPETKRRERTWLRSQLKAFGYVMLQKSLWRGPSPLPKEFKERLKVLKIETGVKTFTIFGNK